MKPISEIYDKIPQVKQNGEFFQAMPGIYCENCGHDFALYSYSFYQPDGLDENNKPFYKKCGIGGCK